MFLPQRLNSESNFAEDNLYLGKLTGVLAIMSARDNPLFVFPTLPKTARRM